MALIREGVTTPKPEVLARFHETLFLRAKGHGARGWLIEVLKCAERAAAAGGSSGGFGLDDVYAFEGRLAALYPANRNVRPKIRQQLQALRDRGLVVFEGRGRYRMARGG